MIAVCILDKPTLALLKILSQFVIRISVSFIMLFHTKVLVPVQSYYLSRFFFDFCPCHILRNASLSHSREYKYIPLFFLSSFQNFFTFISAHAVLACCSLCSLFAILYRKLSCLIQITQRPCCWTLFDSGEPLCSHCQSCLSRWIFINLSGVYFHPKIIKLLYKDSIYLCSM